MTDKTFNVPCQCIGNSARGIMAEAQLKSGESSRFRAFSAGNHPSGLAKFGRGEA